MSCTTPSGKVGSIAKADSRLSSYAAANPISSGAVSSGALGAVLEFSVLLLGQR
jgi:hypothetical protein